MDNQSDKSPNVRYYVTDEMTPAQLVTLEKIERLAGLDPEITERLARALDRIQQTRPYHSVARSAQPSVSPITQLQLTEAERAVREEFITQELGSLLALAGQLVQKYSSTTREAQPDKHFRDQLRGQLFPQK